MFVLSLSDWQHAIVLIAAVIIIVAIMAFIGWRFTLYLEHKRNRDRKAFVHDVITGNHSDEQVIRFMASPIGPRMDVRLIHAVAGSSRMTPKIRKWIFKHYPVALASQPDLSSDEIGLEGRGGKVFLTYGDRENELALKDGGIFANEGGRLERIVLTPA